MDTSFRGQLQSVSTMQSNSVTADWDSLRDSNQDREERESEKLHPHMQFVARTDARLLQSALMQGDPEALRQGFTAEGPLGQPSSCGLPSNPPLVEKINTFEAPISQSTLQEPPESFMQESPYVTSHEYANTLPKAFLEEPDFPKIDFSAACKMGRLKYAAKRKEEARTWFKENTKRKHLAMGEAHKFTRIRRGESSMNGSQLKKRRLRMNQDSAAASRFARDEYILTLEKMIQSAEEQLCSVDRENLKLRQQNHVLKKEVLKLREEVEEYSEGDGILEALCAGKNVDRDQIEKFSKLFDMGANPDNSSAQANGFGVDKYGVKPAPAV